MAVGVLVSDIMKKDVVYLAPEDSIMTAIKRMVALDIGCVVVCKDLKPVGVLTQGDILGRVVIKRKDLDKTLISDVMTSPVKTIAPDSDVEEAAVIMRDLRIKRLPVVDPDGKIVGIVSETDIIVVSPAVYEIIREKARHRIE